MFLLKRKLRAESPKLGVEITEIIFRVKFYKKVYGI